MNENYPSAAEVVRNLAELRAGYEVLEDSWPFQIVRLEPPFFEGYEIWVVNDKGFLWEPAKDVVAARNYLESDEAEEYRRSRSEAGRQ